jgi:hypothetical protein
MEDLLLRSTEEFFMGRSDGRARGCVGFELLEASWRKFENYVFV